MTDLLLQHSSYFALVIVLILTGEGLPIPEEVPVITAGVLSAHGQLIPWLAFACCLVGALIGDVLMYWIGYHFGRSVLQSQTWWARFLKPEREAKIERMIEQHGLKVLFLARFLVGLRSPVYLSAGILRVSFRRFFLTDLFCATTVIGTFFLLSFHYGTVIVGWIRRGAARPDGGRGPGPGRGGRLLLAPAPPPAGHGPFRARTPRRGTRNGRRRRRGCRRDRPGRPAPGGH